MAIHLEFSVDCRSRQASFAMTNQCFHQQERSPFDKLRALSLSNGWIATPSFLAHVMTDRSVKFPG